MRKVILNLVISLDGFIEGPQGEFDWCFIWHAAVYGRNRRCFFRA